MESNSWNTRLSTSSSRRYQNRSGEMRLLFHFDMKRRRFGGFFKKKKNKDFVFGIDLFIGGGFDETDGDEEFGGLYLCPFCAEDFDIVGLCCHIEEDHPVEAKNGVSF